MQEFSGDKTYNDLVAALLLEYKLPNSVANMFQQGLASNAFQSKVSKATKLDTFFILLLERRGLLRLWKYVS